MPLLQVGSSVSVDAGQKTAGEREGLKYPSERERWLAPSMRDGFVVDPSLN